MADISTELARILSAIYGEDVRGSIHDAIEKINDVSEVVLTTGTAVTGPSSSSTGFYDDSLYLNTDTFELWKCTGVNTWASQGILKGDPGADGADGNGIASITKTATSGLVDTYTITYTDGTTSTFYVTNGADGANGNKWYRGTGISGKAALPTVYANSGVADANSGDMFLNPSEGAVYSCVTGGIPTVATWQYEMTLSGGGGGTSDYADLINKPSINGHTLSGNQTGADLGLASSSDIPTVDQTYSATSTNAQSGTAVAQAISSIHGGGMLPYLYIDSEAGATVTVVQPDSTTITPTAAGSGHWECELTGGYGTYVIHSVLSGQGDATLSLAVDTVKEYHVTDTHYDFTINVTAPSGSSIRITGGSETYTETGTGSPQAFAVHTPSTAYTVAVTMDGNTKSETITSAATSGQSGSVTIDFGTINVIVAADFVTAGSTITCAKTGVNTISKTAASTLTFRVPETGEYTISGTVSSTPYSTTATVTSLNTPESVTLQTTVNVNVTLHGAVEDTISFTDASGVTRTEVFASGESNKTVTIAIMPSGSNITFVSSVAKNPEDLTSDFSKTVNITTATTDIYIMPEGEILYWYGYKSDELVNMSRSTGYVNPSAWTIGTPTYNTRTINLTAAGAVFTGVAKRTALDQTVQTVKAIADGISAGGTSGYSGRVGTATSSQNQTNALECTEQDNITPDGLQLRAVTPSQNNLYAKLFAQGITTTANMDVYAFWVE